MKKGRPHGHRYGKLPGSRKYYLANNFKKRCKKKDYEGIHDRFLRDDVFRRRMIENKRDDKVCLAWDVLADEDHTYHVSGPVGDLRGNKQPQDPTMYGDICGNLCSMHQNENRNKSAPSRNRTSIMPDNYVVSSSLNQMMKNLHTMKNVRRKLEIPMSAAMHCKTPANCRRETYRNIGKLLIHTPLDGSTRPFDVSTNSNSTIHKELALW